MFLLSLPLARSVTNLFVTSPSPTLIHFAGHWLLCCWFTVDGLHHSDVGSCNIAHTPTHADRLNNRYSPITAVYSPSSPFSHPSGITGQRLCLACREKSCKDYDSINVQGYYNPFQQYVSSNPRVIHPWWIQTPDQISSQSSFGFTLCFGFIPHW